MGFFDSIKKAIYADDDDEDDDELYEKEMQALERKEKNSRNSRAQVQEIPRSVSRSYESEKPARSYESEKPVKSFEPEKPARSFESDRSTSYHSKKIEEVKEVERSMPKKPDLSDRVPRKEEPNFPSITKITPPRSPENGYNIPAPVTPRTQVDVADVSGYVVSSFSDAQMICDRLAHSKATIVNFEKINATEAQRIMDFICGCIYVLDGNLQAITSTVYIFTPKGMDISGDFASLIKNNSFGVPTFNKML